MHAARTHAQSLNIGLALVLPPHHHQPPVSLHVFLSPCSTVDACTPAGSLSLLTERQYVGQTLPKLASRTSDRASTSRTRPSNPRTWSCLKRWLEFNDRAQKMHAELDDVNPCFAPMVGGDPLSAPLHVIGQSPGGPHAGWYTPPPCGPPFHQRRSGVLMSGLHSCRQANARHLISSCGLIL